MSNDPARNNFMDMIKRTQKLQKTINKMGAGPPLKGTNYLVQSDAPLPDSMTKHLVDQVKDASDKSEVQFLQKQASPSTLDAIKDAMRTIEESRRVVLCPPHMLEKVQEVVDSFEFGPAMFRVLVSRFVPEDKIYILKPNKHWEPER